MRFPILPVSCLLGWSLLLVFPASRLQAVTPLPISPKAKTERMLAAEDADWVRRVWLAPFRERTAGQPWQADAVAIIEKILAERANCTLCGAAPMLLPEVERVLKLGCDDPLLQYLNIATRYCMTGDAPPAEHDLRKLLPRLQELKAPRGLAAAAGIAYLGAAHDARMREIDKEVAMCLRWPVEALGDGSFSPEEWHLFVSLVLTSAGDDWFDQHGAAFLKNLESAKPPEWVLAVLRGHAAVGAAWASRGKKWASEVTDDGWKGFNAGLKEARRSLTRAWELRPDRSEAAEKMIVVVMGGGAARGESLELWRDRALAAVSDSNRALDAYLNALLPRWSGSHGEMFDFAERCLATGRFDTELPFTVSTVGSKLNVDQCDLREVYRMPRMKPLALTMSKGLLDEPSRASERGFRLSSLAVNAWLCGENQLAQETLGRLETPLHPRAIGKLKQAYADEREFRGSLAVATGPAAELYDHSVAARGRGDFASAAAAAKEALALASADPLARDFLAGWLAVVAAEETFARGEWVEIPATPALHGWTDRSGKWRVGASGLPEWVGDGRKARIIFGAEVGAELEMRAEFSFSGSRPTDLRGGVFFGFHCEGSDFERWQGCHVQFDKEKKEFVGAYLLQDNSNALPKIPVATAERYVLEVQVRRGRVTWQVNGVPMHQDVPLWRPVDAKARIGIGSPWAGGGNVMIFHRLAIRRPPAGK